MRGTCQCRGEDDWKGIVQVTANQIPPRRRFEKAVIGFAAVWFGLATAAWAQYTIVDLGDLGGGFSRARAINDLGQVAGEALLPVEAVIDQAVLWQGGSIANLGTLGGAQSAAYGINNSGAICGWAQGATGSALPALWMNGTATALPTLGGSSGFAYAVNNAGVVVGYSSISTGANHATLWSDAEIRDLGTLGGTYSVAYDINNSGSVVGSANGGALGDRATLWQAGEIIDLGGLSGGLWREARAINEVGHIILVGAVSGATGTDRAAFWDGNLANPVTTLGTLGGNQSWAFAMNDYDAVVGRAEESDGTYHAFVWNGDEMTDLGTLGGYYSSAHGINDQGVIVGWAMDALGYTHAVEWVPVPEPAAPILGLLGGIMVGLWRKRQKTAGANVC